MNQTYKFGQGKLTWFIATLKVTGFQELQDLFGFIHTLTPQLYMCLLTSLSHCFLRGGTGSKRWVRSGRLRDLSKQIRGAAKEMSDRVICACWCGFDLVHWSFANLLKVGEVMPWFTWPDLWVWFAVKASHEYHVHADKFNSHPCQGIPCSTPLCRCLNCLESVRILWGFIWDFQLFGSVEGSVW